MCFLWEKSGRFPGSRAVWKTGKVSTPPIFSSNPKDEAVFVAGDLVLEADLKFQLHRQHWWKHHPIFVPWVAWELGFSSVRWKFYAVKVSLFFFPWCEMLPQPLKSLFLLLFKGWCLCTSPERYLAGYLRYLVPLLNQQGPSSKLPGCWPRVPRVSRAYSAWRGSCELQPYCLE